MHDVIFKSLLPFLLLASLGSTAEAQSEDNDSLALYVAVPLICVSYSKPLNPNATTRVDKDRISTLHEPIIAQLLNSVPGVFMQSGTIGTNRLTLRGVGYREPFATTGIKVYLNEIPLTNGAGEASFEDIPAFLLDGIEVDRGPAASHWGAGLGGAIVLHSNPPLEDQAVVQVQGGSFGRFQTDAGIAFRYGFRKAWATRIGYQLLTDDGYRENNRTDKQAFSLLQYWKPRNTDWHIRGQLHLIDLKAGIPSALSYADYKNSPANAAATWKNVSGNEDYIKSIAGLSAVYTPGLQTVWNISVFSNTFHSDEVRPFNILNEQSVALGSSLRGLHELSDKYLLRVGAEFYHEQYRTRTFETLAHGQQGDPLQHVDQRATSGFLFGKIAREFTQSLTVTVGLSASVQHITDTLLRKTIRPEIFPMIGWQWRVHDHVEVAGAINRGYSALSPDDLLNADGTVVPHIQLETGWNGELTLRYQKTQVCTVSVTGYMMHVRNTLVTRRLMDDLFEKFSGGSSWHRGIELSVAIQDNRQRIALLSSYTYSAHAFDHFEDFNIRYDGKTLPGIPKHHLFQELTLRPWSHWTLRLAHQLVSTRYLNDLNTEKVRGYDVVTASAGYAGKISEKVKWHASLHLHNVFDVDYAPLIQVNAPGQGGNNRYYYPGKPRAGYVRIGIEYAL